MAINRLFSPFQHAHRDIILEIISVIIQSTLMYDAFQTVWACAEVCTSWRNILLHHTSFWSLIIYLDPEDPRSSQVMKRAGTLDLTVECHFVSEVKNEALIRRLLSNWERVKILDLIVPAPHVASDILDRLLLCAAPALRTIRVVYDDGTCPDEDVIHRLGVTFPHNVPQLAHFSLPLGLVVSDLQHLCHLNSLECCPDYDFFLADLLPSCFPNLQHLCLRQRVGLRPSGSEIPSGQQHPIVLPRLRSLVVSCVADDWPACMQFLQRLQCKGVYFRLECTNTSSQISGDGIAALLNLQHLIRGCFQRLPMDCAQAFESGPTLLKFTESHMEIRCSGFFEFSIKHDQDTQDWRPWMVAMVRLLHPMASYWAQHLRLLFGAMSLLSEDLESLGPQSLK
ncbi:hypothetical protein CPC08DRAFT_137434 [Agrocybe pediades]|nr:hypothetical protein CPC08DRAFT_137434 [Agrocybe pediades]